MVPCGLMFECKGNFESKYYRTLINSKLVDSNMGAVIIEKD